MNEKAGDTAGARTACPGSRTGEPPELQLSTEIILRHDPFASTPPSRLGGEVNIRGIPIYRNQLRSEIVSLCGNPDQVVTV